MISIRPRSTRCSVLHFLLPAVLVPIPLPAQEPGPAPVVDVHAYHDAPTADGSVELYLDLYRPSGLAKGAVVLAHGGGFSDGHRGLRENRDYGEALARRGYLAAAISYRLHGDGPVVEGWASEYSAAVAALDDARLRGAMEQLGPAFPDAVAAASVDVAHAVSWLREHATDLGFEPGKIALFGASAGAIAALTDVYAADHYGGKRLDVAGVIDLRGFLIHPEGMENPFREGDPPLLLLHGEADRRVPLANAEHVFGLAAEAGVPAWLYTAPGYGHELGAGRLLRLRIGPGMTVLDRIDAFLGTVFSGEPVAALTRRARLLPPAEGPGATGGPAMVVQRELRTAVRELAASVEDASAFVPSLYGTSRAELLHHDLTAPERRNWSYWPRTRAGLPLHLMTAEQRRLTHRVLSTLLSSRGYLQVNHVMQLEDVLAARESVGFERDSDAYTLALFGDAAAGTPWGLRFEGHHVSLNATVSPEGISVTPSFLGAAPVPVESGPRAGFDPLVHERRHAFDLLASLDREQRAAAVLGDEPPTDVLTSQFRVERADWDAWWERLDGAGVSTSTFDAPQKKILRHLLEQIVGTYRPEIAEGWLQALDTDTLTFAWMGGTEPGQPHYFRIEGRRFVFELDAAQDDGAHVHTVWRDREGDFGADLLPNHYRQNHDPGG